MHRWTCRQNTYTIKVIIITKTADHQEIPTLLYLTLSLHLCHRLRIIEKESNVISKFLGKHNILLWAFFQWFTVMSLGFCINLNLILLADCIRSKLSITPASILRTTYKNTNLGQRNDSIIKTEGDHVPSTHMVVHNSISRGSSPLLANFRTRYT